MKVPCFVLFVLVLCGVSRVECRAVYYDLKKAPQLFEKFRQNFHKIYSCPEETQHRYRIFELNLMEFNRINSKEKSNVAVINQFSDMTIDEVLQNCMGYHYGQSRITYDIKKAPQLFEKFRHDFNKKYSGPEETQRRYKIFELNLIEFNRINSKPYANVAVINKFTDMTVDEVLQNCLGYYPGYLLHASAKDDSD